MKKTIILGSCLLLSAMTIICNAQEFTLTTTGANIIASKASIDTPGLSGNPQAIIIATPLGDAPTMNPHPIGAWYYNGKWNIFNTDHAPMTPGLKFKIEVFLKPGPAQFLHIINKENLGDDGSYIDNPLLNNHPNANVRIFQNYAPDNRAPYNLNKYEAKAFYNAASGKWYIKNVNDKPLFQNLNTAYNVSFDPGATGGAGTQIPSPISTPPTTPAATPATAPRPTPTPVISAIQPPAISPGTPCTTEAAYQTIGKWGTQKKDDLAMADRTFPKDQYKPVLAKAQKVVELFKLAHPEFKGIQANAERAIRGDAYSPNGALPFRLDIGYGSYICVGQDTYIAAARGKVILFGGYGYTTVFFNTLGDLLTSVQEGKPLLTPEGEEIFEFKKELGEFKGFPMIQPATRTEDHNEAIIITPGNRLPYKPVTREQYLQARLKNFRELGGFASEITSLTTAIGNMSPAERQIPAIVRDISALPGRAKLFAAESEGGKHLVTIDKSFFNSKLPRDTIQMIAVHWNWSDKIPPKAEAIRQFKQNFNFEALRQMLGK